MLFILRLWEPTAINSEMRLALNIQLRSYTWPESIRRRKWILFSGLRTWEPSWCKLFTTFLLRYIKQFLFCPIEIYLKWFFLICFRHICPNISREFQPTRHLSGHLNLPSQLPTSIIAQLPRYTENQRPWFHIKTTNFYGMPSSWTERFVNHFRRNESWTATNREKKEKVPVYIREF